MSVTAGSSMNTWRPHSSMKVRSRSMTSIDLSTTYLGLPLQNPLVASASPISKQVDLVRRLEDAGASAVVMYSLFEEQITHESLELDFFLHRGTEVFSEALSY